MVFCQPQPSVAL